MLTGVSSCMVNRINVWRLTRAKAYVVRNTPRGSGGISPGPDLVNTCDHIVSRKAPWVHAGNLPTPFAETVQDRPVLRPQCSFHDFELESSIFRCVVNAIDGKFVSAEGACVVPGIVIRDGRLVGAAAIDLANPIESGIAVACEALVNPFRSRKAVVIL